MVEILNRQRQIKIETEVFRKFTLEALKIIEETDGKVLSVAFISDRQMKMLNRDFRGKNQTTDVLSFPAEKLTPFEEESFLGDIAISLEQASRQANENGLTLEQEIKQLILHGILHLSGYDHETDNGEMNSLELQYRDKLNIS